MSELQKYKETLMYLAGIIVVAVFLFQKIQPEFNKTMDLYKQIDTQKEVASSLSKQLSTAKAKEEKRAQMQILDDLTKKIYTPAEGLSLDADSTFSVLLDDVIEISRKNHIKTHSLRSVINPEDDPFVKGAKDKFSACRLSMKIVSDYSDFEGFIRDLYAYNYLVNINDIEIYPYQKNKRVLLINLTITLYSSIAVASADSSDEDENADDEDSSSDKKKKPKKAMKPNAGDSEEE